MTIIKQLGMRIRYLREMKKMTLEDLEDASGVSKNYISDLERANRNPTTKVLYKIANGLGVSLEELFKGIK